MLEGTREDDVPWVIVFRAQAARVPRKSPSFITALSLGAPFWFDVLSKFVNLRSAGIKPKRTDETPA